MENMLDRLRGEYAERLMHMKEAADELGETMEHGTKDATFSAGQWLEVNARQLATIAESIARLREAEKC